MKSRARALLLALCALAAGIAFPEAARADKPNFDDKCADFVHLVDGRFFAADTPFAMEGPNFIMEIAGVPGDPNADPPWEYFLSPTPTFQPDANAVCNGSSQDPCCYTRDTCRDDLQYDIDTLVGMGANSVRLIVPRMEWDETDPNGHFTPTLHCSTAHMPASSAIGCKMDLMDTYQRTRALDLIEEQINLLGDYGIRTVLLTGRTDNGDQHAELEYGLWLEDLAKRLVNNPYLIAYDPMNEPLYEYDPVKAGYPATYNCPTGPSSFECKTIAETASKGWYQHITSQDPNHLITLGLGGYDSVFSWDPAVLWDHFTSYHIYANPAAPWDDPGAGSPAGGPAFPAGTPVSGGHGVQNSLYYGSLNTCGVRCPYIGQDDGENCYVGPGPVGSIGFLQDGGFDYHQLPSGNPCPIGTNLGTECQAATYEPGRDDPFILGQPLYYVVAGANGSCPAGTTFDTANCLAFTGPPNAQPFLWTNQAGSTGFYYSYLSPDHHCDGPATDDTRNCYLGPVPSGWQPFIMKRPLYYVKPVTCDGHRKPAYFGEAGFSSYPYPTGSPAYPVNQQSPYPVQEQRHACDIVERGPEVDTVEVDGQIFEAEAAVTAPSVVVTDNTVSGGHYVRTEGGGQFDIYLGPVAPSGCSFLKIRYRAYSERHLWISMAGRAPRRFTFPSTSGAWSDRKIDMEFPSSAQTLVFGTPHDSADGDFTEQAQFLTGNGSSWPGLFPYGRACGFQGLHYWLYGPTTHWGSCGYSATTAFWYQVNASLILPPPQDQIQILLTPAGEALRDQVDFLAYSNDKCDPPTHFHEGLSRSVGPNPQYAYDGLVQDPAGHPIANAPVRAWVQECSKWPARIDTFTDSHGHYHFDSSYPLAQLGSTHFGYDNHVTWTTTNTPNTPNSIPTITLSPLANLVHLSPPQPPRSACRGADGWVPQ